MKLQNSYDTGVYVRLSRDDNNGNLESMSIANQKQILSDFVKEKRWNLVDIYVDDGYSGTNFERPDFKRMIRDIEAGRVNCVVTKDLSRLGRNYSMTGYYTDEYFPEQHVRYIAINDGVDTMGNNNDFAAFHNVINEYYPRDISRKVRQVKRTNAGKGMFMGSWAPYGYKKSPEDKHVLLIDEYAAPILKRIFNEFVNGRNARMIADELNQEDVLSPMCYRYHREGKEIPKKYQNGVWGSATIMEMLGNQVYLGRMVQGKREVVSFKSKKRRVTEPEEWIIEENTHEAIIDQELWDLVQKYRAFRRPRKLKAERTEAIFTGLLHCADCGSIMTASLCGGGKPKLSYRCSRYTNSGNNACTIHTIREEVLESIVLDHIHAYAKLADEDKDELTQRILYSLKSESKQSSQTVRMEFDRVQLKIDQTNTIIRNLYKDKVSGKIPESIFYSLLTDYQKELAELESNLPRLKEQLDSSRDINDNINRWVEMIHSYLEVKHLDRCLARALIDNITVSERYKVDGRYTQDVSITYRFVGNLKKLLDKVKDVA